MIYRFTVNGQRRSVDVWDPSEPLLYVLRNDLGLTGAKVGCGLGQCGTCTVLLDDRAIRSCLVPIASVAKALAADARRGQRPAELGVIEAQLASAKAVMNEAETALARVRPLTEAGAASKAALDEAVAARDTARANVRAIEKQLQVAKLGAREDQRRAAEDRVRQAEAGLAAAAARLSDLSPVAPSAGRIEDVFFQKGEWVPANQPVLAMIPNDRVRLRFFVPQADVARYTIGSEVRFACDGCPSDLTATISYVSPRPEFTPPGIYSREARDRMVFLVEAQPAKGEGLMPGLPIDVQRLEAKK